MFPPNVWKGGFHFEACRPWMVFFKSGNSLRPQNKKQAGSGENVTLTPVWWMVMDFNQRQCWDEHSLEQVVSEVLSHWVAYCAVTVKYIALSSATKPKEACSPYGPKLLNHPVHDFHKAVWEWEWRLRCSWGCCAEQTPPQGSHRPYRINILYWTAHQPNSSNAPWYHFCIALETECNSVEGGLMHFIPILEVLRTKNKLVELSEWNDRNFKHAWLDCV